MVVFPVLFDSVWGWYNITSWGWVVGSGVNSGLVDVLWVCVRCGFHVVVWVCWW